MLVRVVSLFSLAIKLLCVNDVWELFFGLLIIDKLGKSEFSHLHNVKMIAKNERLSFDLQNNADLLDDVLEIGVSEF